jgi:hypothetical protein
MSPLLQRRYPHAPGLSRAQRLDAGCSCLKRFLIGWLVILRGISAYGSNPAHGMQNEKAATESAAVFALPFWGAWQIGQGDENKNGQTQAFGRSKRPSSLQASMSSRMNFSTLRFAPSYP